MKRDQIDGLLSLQEACIRIGVPARVLRFFIKKGRLRAWPHPTDEFRVHPGDLQGLNKIAAKHRAHQRRHNQARRARLKEQAKAAD